MVLKCNCVIIMWICECEFYFRYILHYTHSRKIHPFNLYFVNSFLFQRVFSLSLSCFVLRLFVCSFSCFSFKVFFYLYTSRGMFWFRFRYITTYNDVYARSYLCVFIEQYLHVCVAKNMYYIWAKHTDT